LPAGSPFVGFAVSFYWSSTTIAFSTDLAWGVTLVNGFVSFDDKTLNSGFVTAVRGGS
jgi:hypothetical protein